MREGTARCAVWWRRNSIRGGANRRILDRIARDGVIFDAWDDEPWVLDGAAVRVSLVCFSRRVSGEEVRLDGRYVQRINPDLTAAFDLTAAVSLAENAGVAFSGISKKGKFEIPGNIAREWLGMPLNPNGRANSDVLFHGGTGRFSRTHSRLLDHQFWGEITRESAFYENPFSYLERVVHPVRRKSRSDLERNNWWKLARRAPTMFTAARSLRNFLVTPETSKHRIFSWCPCGVIPDKNLVVIAKDDDAIFGIIHSRFHSAWALRLGTSLEDRPRYTSSTTFRTFPFPEGLTQTSQLPMTPMIRVLLQLPKGRGGLTSCEKRGLNPPRSRRAIAGAGAGLSRPIVPGQPKSGGDPKNAT